MVKKILLLLVCSLSIGMTQILTTAETVGKGKQALFVSENRLYVGGDELNIAYGMYIRGLTKRFDLYTSLGETRIFRQNQVWLGLGGNYHLFRLEKVDVSLFNILSTPLHRRGDASTALLNSAIVVSRSLTERLALYSGVNSFVPVGATSRGLFTPPTKKINVPLGVAIFLKKWLVFSEVDIGKLKSVSLAISRTF